MLNSALRLPKVKLLFASSSVKIPLRIICSSSAAISIHPFFNAKNATEENREKFKGKLDNFIKNMEKLLDENGGDWMVGKGFTWADLYIAVVLQQVRMDGTLNN